GEAVGADACPGGVPARASARVPAAAARAQGDPPGALPPARPDEDDRRGGDPSGDGGRDRGARLGLLRHGGGVRVREGGALRRLDAVRRGGAPFGGWAAGGRGAGEGGRGL